MEKTIAGKQITVNEEGYLTDFNQWNEQVAEALALEAEVSLTPRHWEVLKYLQNEQKPGGAEHSPYWQKRFT